MAEPINNPGIRKPAAAAAAAASSARPQANNPSGAAQDSLTPQDSGASPAQGEVRSRGVFGHPAVLIGGIVAASLVFLLAVRMFFGGGPSLAMKRSQLGALPEMIHLPNEGQGAAPAGASLDYLKQGNQNETVFGPDQTVQAQTQAPSGPIAPPQKPKVQAVAQSPLPLPPAQKAMPRLKDLGWGKLSTDMDSISGGMDQGLPTPSVSSLKPFSAKGKTPGAGAPGGLPPGTPAGAAGGMPMGLPAGQAGGMPNMPAGMPAGGIPAGMPDIQKMMQQAQGAQGGAAAQAPPSTGQ